MTKDIVIEPSILSADFSRLREDVKKIEDSGADAIHIDVMDGHFVPNITIGPVVIAAIKRSSNLPLDVHLMIEEPHKFIREFVDVGSDSLTVHAESYGYTSGIRHQALPKGGSKSVSEIDEVRLRKVLARIKGFGKKAGVSLNPDSPFCIEGIVSEVDVVLIMSVHPGFGGQKFIERVLPKIKEARRLYSGDIAVDGGINDKNVASVIDAGANIIVAGAYFFRADDPKEAVKKLKRKIKILDSKT